MEKTQVQALVIGAGPAGLMAADVLSKAGHQVLVADAMPSVGRKFLMAGKSGLNLTNDASETDFLEAYGDAKSWLGPMVRAFGSAQVRAWAEDLGQPLFSGSSGRVFPSAMKASPLLRSWLRRLSDAGTTFQTRWRWQGWEGTEWLFDTPDGPKRVSPHATVLALGGASWRRLGSNGAWKEQLTGDGHEVTPFAPANMGVSVNWSSHMTAHIGTPVKNVAIATQSARHRGEFVISSNGLEGGGIYLVAPALRDAQPVTLDLLPDLSQEEVSRRLAATKPKQSLSNRLRKALKLEGNRVALLREFAHPLPTDPDGLAAQIKALEIRHDGPRPIDEAISTAGGVARGALTETLMLRARPGTFCAGEMLDWESPTGGFLLTACLATGRWAGLGAVKWLQTDAPVTGAQKLS